MKIEDFAETGPAFRPDWFFVGKAEGWGVLEGPTGSLLKRFAVKAEGELLAGEGHFRYSETWIFDDGRVDILNWEIRASADGRLSGVEDRSDGEATGEVAGCAFHWRYTRDTPQSDGKTLKLNFDDWFFRIDETGVMVRGTAGRLGLPFATAHVSYRKLD